ncbi:MAG: helix-turn-helix transcriptional regulator [Senegalimassilia anaerobia]|uniref:helix-turn-helix domain-containing protein n=1 Tax=Senegalimassilia anaerobia TaxID=1473216 RepID=UPI002E77006A|nr:helix-turn-helix transcriptional regulator [Senegalimassilia anaerobia]MEE0303062.1 helix-turn-helix transcriptional regulator [Senegalimassilia anaerobia]
MSTDERRKRTGARIKTLREQQGLSQRKLALMIGSNQTHIWQIENGTVNVGLDLLCRLADALEVNVRDLIDF